MIAFFHIDVIQRHGAISHARNCDVLGLQEPGRLVAFWPLPAADRSRAMTSLAREKRINSPCIPEILNTLVQVVHPITKPLVPTAWIPPIAAPPLPYSDKRRPDYLP